MWRVNAHLEVGGGEVASKLAGIVHQRHSAHITSPEGVKDLELYLRGRERVRVRQDELYHQADMSFGAYHGVVHRRRHDAAGAETELADGLVSDLLEMAPVKVLLVDETDQGRLRDDVLDLHT